MSSAVNQILQVAAYWGERMTPEALRQGQALARDLGFSLISNQPQYSMRWRVIEREVIPTCEDIGTSPMVWPPSRREYSRANTFRVRPRRKARGRSTR